jgi:hypothetical protein
MGKLIINRINFRFNKEVSCFLNISRSSGFWLVGNKVEWTRKKLPTEYVSRFERWLSEEGIDPKEDFLKYNFADEGQEACFTVQLDSSTMHHFKTKIFIQELATLFIEHGFYIEPGRKVVDFSAYHRVGDFDSEYERYRRIDFKWNWRREELSYNIGSESTLITRQKKGPENGTRILNETTQLIHKRRDDDTAPRKSFPATRINQGTPKKFNYSKRYNDLKTIAIEYLNAFQSRFFEVDKSGLKTVDPRDVQAIFSRQNLMAFGGGKTSVNAALGMREFGPYEKIPNANRAKLLFIYDNRDDANNLYLYLRNGLKHFPGLLSYAGIPVSLPDHNDRKGLKYNGATSLPVELKEFLEAEYPEQAYPETMAIIIGPFSKFESDEEESDVYYNVKKLLLGKGISSQFVNSSTIKDPNFHYALPNIAVAILAKLGGIPWKLATKRYNELVIGFNTIKHDEGSFLGSAVFFDNEGKIGRVHGFPQADGRGIVRHLRSAILQYAKECGEPDRMVIHYYKPPQEKELKDIEFILKEEMNLPIPFAVVEVNDSKTKLEICFDTEYRMGMPESGTYVKVGRDEYLLFNNNRYQKSPVRRIEEELPIKVKISFADTGGFHHKELITQVYEFSRIYWKGLKQQSQPVTTRYSKLIASFSSKFGGEIPDNIVAQCTPWFI